MMIIFSCKWITCIRKYFSPRGGLSNVVGGWENKEVMDLADEAMNPDLTTEERRAIYSELFSIFLEEIHSENHEGVQRHSSYGRDSYWKLFGGY